MESDLASPTEPSPARQDWLDTVKKPPASCRPQLQWSWNGNVRAERIRPDLEEFQSKGIGGFFMHARPGLEIGYLHDEWFDLWKTAADHCRELGMEWHIYDEYTCPGGLAGGHTVANAPATAAIQLKVLPVSDPSQLPAGEVLAWFEEGPDNGSPQRVADVSLKNWQPGRRLIAAVLAQPVMNATNGSFPPPDLTHPQATPAFLASTHERYLATSGEHFGKTTRYCFCDEPALYHRNALLLNLRLLEIFAQAFGYRLEDRLEALCFDEPDSPEVRFDYWTMMHRQWEERFMKPMFDWCEAHDLKFTGHLMENQWPSPRSTPDCMASYRWMHAPGNDLLGFQFKGACLGDHGLYVLNLKELSSAASQLGWRSLMVESSGASGYNTSYEKFKACEDFLLTFGVNVMDPHLGHWTLAGARKYDWAHTITPHSPWWECYKTHADHIATVIAAQEPGQEYNRVLVLHPTLTGWLWEAPREGGWQNARGEAALQKLREVNLEFLVTLTGGQIDYDLGDEWLLKDFGTVEDGKIRVGERLYDLVVLPPMMQTWLPSTLEKMTALLESGGTMVAAGEPPERIGGRLNPAAAGLAARFPDQWLKHLSPEACAEAVRERVAPRVTGSQGEPLPDGLLWRRTVLPWGDRLWWFCAPWPGDIDTVVKFEDSAGSWAEIDTATGALTALDSPKEGLPLQLPERGHRLLLQSNSALPTQPAPSRNPVDLKMDSLTLERAQRQEPNLFVLDYAQLRQRDGQWGPLQCTFQLDRENWRRHGFTGNPWPIGGGHKFGRQALEYPFESGTGCAVKFEAELDLESAALSEIELALERPALYEVTVNGQPVPAENFRRWFEDEFGSAPVGHLLRKGRNEIILTAPVMDSLVEIMPIYLRGDFGVWPAKQGFRASDEGTIQLGDWREFGSPFYRGWMRYEFRFDLAETAHELAIALPDWKGGAMRVALDQPESWLPVLHPPFVAEFQQAVEAGSHILYVEVASTLYNMIGPHHSEGLSGPWSWQAAPEVQPAGKDYLLKPAGLGVTDS